MNRRNILKLLGIAAPASVVTETFAAEDVVEFSPKGVPGLMTRSAETQEKFARMLEAMAASIRARDMACLGIKIGSEATFETWIKHSVTIECEVDASEAPVEKKPDHLSSLEGVKDKVL